MAWRRGGRGRSCCPRSLGKEESILKKVQVASGPRGGCCPVLVIEGRETQLEENGISRKEERVTRPSMGEGMKGGGSSSAALLVGGESGDPSWWMTSLSRDQELTCAEVLLVLVVVPV